MKTDVLAAPDAIARLVVALAHAEHRVRTLRREALVGGRYRPREFDQAVKESRQLRALLGDVNGATRPGSRQRHAA